MTTINNTFVNAVLADAAYAERLRDGLKGDGLKDRLDPTMTPSLANRRAVANDKFSVEAA